MKTEVVHKEITELVLELERKDERYTKLYGEYCRMRDKLEVANDTILILKKENLEHMRGKVILQDEILEKDLSDSNKVKSLRQW